MLTLSDHLRAMRRARGYRVREVASRLRVAPVTVYAWELGHRAPRPHRLEQLLDVYDAREDQRAIAWRLYAAASEAAR